MKRKYIANARLFVTNEIASHVQLSEKPLQIFLCLLLTFLNDFFVTLLWLFLASFSSLFCHLLTFLNDFFVIALCLYFSPVSSFFVSYSLFWIFSLLWTRKRGRWLIPNLTFRGPHLLCYLRYPWQRSNSNWSKKWQDFSNRSYCNLLSSSFCEWPTWCVHTLLQEIIHFYTTEPLKCIVEELQGILWESCWLTGEYPVA